MDAFVSAGSWVMGNGSRVTGRPGMRLTSTDYSVEVEIFSDLQGLSRTAADRFADAAAKAIASKGSFAVALSGGSTPRSLYLLLGSDHYIRTIDWLHVHIFWADERCVPEDDEQSNAKFAYDAFLTKVPVPDGNVHRIKVREAADDGARAYEDTLREFFGNEALPTFDLVLLGLGQDGHTASLFPNSPALSEKERWAVAVPKEPPELDRISLTLPVLNNASQVIFLAAGSEKAHIVQEVLEDPDAEEPYPAALVRPARGRVIWLIDKAAAGLLHEK
jgi:6-phosphogluconolactonase